MGTYQWEAVSVSIGSVLMRYAENLNLLEKLELMKPISRAVQRLLDGTDRELRASVLEILKQQPKLKKRQRMLISAQVEKEVKSILATIAEELKPQGWRIN